MPTDRPKRLPFPYGCSQRIQNKSSISRPLQFRIAHKPSLQSVNIFQIDLLSKNSQFRRKRCSEHNLPALTSYKQPTLTGEAFRAPTSRRKMPRHWPQIRSGQRNGDAFPGPINVIKITKFRCTQNV